MTTRQAFLLIGSPRARSTSAALGGYLLQRLQTLGWQAAQEMVNPALRSPARWQGLLEHVRQADLVILACPLYVDQLPAPVIQTLEQLAAMRQEQTGHGPAFMAVINCGFPEAFHNQVALQIVQQFCSETGFDWVGGLALGGGGVVGGQSLEEAGGRAYGLRQALTLCAAALDQNKSIPAEAVELFAKPIVPQRLYRLMGDMGWVQSAYQNGVLSRLNSRPYTGGPLGPAAEKN